ncbi:hypothetical protein [Pedosphaera parvula]|uniref:Uncharacterized protein n=1 Tax=Pedosphaera parvula (strain Ellin514) TaxID=320771 RepID=B9XDN0_PEDPL|nr:hypothetical protein [Pedosphaera parvula]EEF62176.1 hypothetical protein Cflav_PD6451 [Pedosphaera parvula Ellin514]
MKKAPILIFLSLLTCCTEVWADDPDDQYVAIYKLFEQADSLKENGQPALALAKYRESQYALKNLQFRYPDWNVKVFVYRQHYLANKVSELAAKVPQSEQNSNSTTTLDVSESSRNGLMSPAITGAGDDSPALPVDSGEQIKALENRMYEKELESRALQLKLKETLTTKRAVASPEEVTKSTERINELKKENELLKATLDQAKKKVIVTASDGLNQSRQSQAETSQKLSELARTNAGLTLEQEVLQGKIKTFEQQIADLKRKAAAATQSEDQSRQLKEARTRIASLQSQQEAMQQEKIDLQEKMRRQERTLVVPAY